MPLSRVSFSRSCAVARRDRVAGVQHHLAGEFRRVVLGELRHRLVRHREQDRVAERQRLRDGPGLGERSKPVGERLELLRMARGEHDGMAGLDPEAADGAADVARADDADLELVCGRLRACEPGQRRGGEQCGCADAEQTAAAVVDDIVGHDGPPAGNTHLKRRTIVAGRWLLPSRQCEAMSVRAMPARGKGAATCRRPTPR